MLSTLLAKLRRFRAEVVILFDGEKATVQKGKHPRTSVRDLEDLLVRHSVAPGEIHILPTGRVEFDGSAPECLHQSLRNVLSG